jgi:hypothetical protein
MRLDARLALGPRKEWGSQNDDIELEAAFGGDFEWDISEKEQLKCASYFIPTFGDLDDYRGIISAEWRLLFDTEMNFSVIVGTEYEYQSIVDSGKDHGDSRTYLGLRYDF